MRSLSIWVIGLWLILHPSSLFGEGQREWFAVYNGFLSVDEKDGSACKERGRPNLVTVYLRSGEGGEIEAYVEGRTIEDFQLLGGELAWPQGWITPKRYRVEAAASPKEFSLKAEHTKPPSEQEAQHCFYLRFGVGATHTHSDRPDHWAFKEAQDRYLARADYHKLQTDAPEIFAKLEALTDQAALLEREGQLAEASKRWRQAAEVTKERFGTTHPLHIQMVVRSGDLAARVPDEQMLVVAANLMGYAARMQMARDDGAFSPLVVDYGNRQRQLVQQVFSSR